MIDPDISWERWKGSMFKVCDLKMGDLFTFHGGDAVCLFLGRNAAGYEYLIHLNSSMQLAGTLLSWLPVRLLSSYEDADG